MNQTIIALSGRKSAGKNTLCQFIRHYFTQHVVCKNNPTYEGHYHNQVELHTVECSFADDLKEFCVNTLGLKKEHCYGSEEEKNLPTDYLWDDVPPFLRWKFGTDPILKEMSKNSAISEEMRLYYYHAISTLAEEEPHRYPEPEGLRTGPMSGREVMQIFGTDLIRETFGNVWAAATIRRIKRNGKSLSVITDNRFPNEIEAVLHHPNGFIIRLTRSPFGCQDLHPSEAALDSYNWNKDRCFVLDNSNLNMEEQKSAVIPILNRIFGLQGVSV